MWEEGVTMFQFHPHNKLIQPSWLQLIFVKKYKKYLYTGETITNKMKLLERHATNYFA